MKHKSVDIKSLVFLVVFGDLKNPNNKVNRFRVFICGLRRLFLGFLWSWFSVMEVSLSKLQHIALLTGLTFFEYQPAGGGGDAVDSPLLSSVVAGRSTVRRPNTVDEDSHCRRWNCHLTASPKHSPISSHRYEHVWHLYKGMISTLVTLNNYY